MADVIIIGAGPSGLMAAYTLTRAGKKVIVLEANNRTGGRIHTIGDTRFFNHAELGAEFVHGNLPVTLALLNEAKIRYHHSEGTMLNFRKGEFTETDAIGENWPLLMQKMHDLEKDMTLNAFLAAHFPGKEFTDLKDAVRRYASGYDTCDPFRVSVFALRREWSNEDEESQFRIKGGYCELIRYFVTQIKAAGGEIWLNAAAKNVTWEEGSVKVKTADGDTYKAKKLVFALPLGVWQAPEGERGTISIQPPLEAQTEGLKQLGFGAVIKVLMQFDDMFWTHKETEKATGQKLKDLGFVISDEAIPVWWTQHPSHSPVLTGWLGGPAAAKLANAPDEHILEHSLQSLANIFKRDAAELKAKMVAGSVVNWTAEPYTRGAYAYDTLATIKVVPMLKQSVDSTLYFAGEFMYQGPAMGTVEAALTSGREAAEEILRGKF